MRIVAGKYKYRKIEVPENARPTPERVREAIFSMIGTKVEGAVVLDLFAGSGAMGLEALSRGASLCYFNEIDRRHFGTLKSNVVGCRAESASVLLNRDFRNAIAGIEGTVDLVFLDPPYSMDLYGEILEKLDASGVLSEGAFVVVEHVYNNKITDTPSSLEKIKEKKYGNIGVDVFMRH